MGLEKNLNSDLSAERKIIIRTLIPLVEPLQAVLPAPSEVVLHDLSKLPNSIVAIAGNITERSIGGVATNTLMQDASSGNLDTKYNYNTKAADGSDVSCSTIVFRASNGTPVAALCVIKDVSVWKTLQQALNSLIPPAVVGNTQTPPPDAEVFSKDVDELAADLLKSAIARAGSPVAKMTKSQKIAVVADLQDRGFFVLKESVEKVASALEVTRFTIYNYLKELGNRK